MKKIANIKAPQKDFANGEIDYKKFVTLTGRSPNYSRVAQLPVLRSDGGVVKWRGKGEGLLARKNEKTDTLRVHCPD